MNSLATLEAVDHLTNTYSVKDSWMFTADFFVAILTAGLIF